MTIQLGKSTRKKTKAEVERELESTRKDLAAAQLQIADLQTQVNLLRSIVTDAAKKEYVPMPYPYAPNPMAPYVYGGDQRAYRCSDGTGNHEYPNAWWGINPPPCRKCGHAPPWMGPTWLPPGINFEPIPAPWVDPVYYRTTNVPNATEVTTIGMMTQPSTVCAPQPAFDTVGCAPAPAFERLDMLPRASGGHGATWVATAATAAPIAGLAVSTSTPGVH